jgi:hypothetical protein
MIEAACCHDSVRAKISAIQPLSFLQGIGLEIVLLLLQIEIHSPQGVARGRDVADSGKRRKGVSVRGISGWGGDR